MQPIEVYAVAEARDSRRSRDLEMLASAVLVVARQIPRMQDDSPQPPTFEEFLKMFPWYDGRALKK